MCVNQKVVSKERKIKMINSVSQSPSFGKNVFLYVTGDSEKAAKAVKEAFNGYNVKKADIGSMYKNVNKYVVDCEEWGTKERDLLWSKLIGRRVAEENGAKKVVYDGFPTFVSMA